MVWSALGNSLERWMWMEDVIVMMWYGYAKSTLPDMPSMLYNEMLQYFNSQMPQPSTITPSTSKHSSATPATSSPSA